MSRETLCIGLTYDLRQFYLDAGYSDFETAEFDREDTIEGIATALRSLGYRVDLIGNLKQLAARLVNGERWPLIFNICEGLHGLGREAQVPALLDAYEIPYVFSDALTCALTLHKGMTKDVVRGAGIATPDYFLVHSPADLAKIKLPYPVFAKPVAEGTGKGVTAHSKISSPTELQLVCTQLLEEHSQAVLVECFLPGREFTVGILGTGDQAEALATMEIELRATAEAGVYSYHNKEEYQQLVDYRLLASGQLRQEVEALALHAWQVLGCRDGGRVDVRLDQSGAVHFLEVNPLAGLHPVHSDLSIMASLAGVTYETLLDHIVNSAWQRCKDGRRNSSWAA